MELWRQVFPGSKETKRRIILKDKFLGSEQISKKSRRKSLAGRLLWNSENREHMKDFRKVDWVAAKKNALYLSVNCI